MPMTGNLRQWSIIVSETPDPLKQAAARQAAAHHATDLAQAVACYATLTGQTEMLAHHGPETLEEELCSLLPAYRHPVHDASTEYILFVDPAGLPAAHCQPDLPAVLADDTAWLAEELRGHQQLLAQLTRQERKSAADWAQEIDSFRQQRAYATYVRLVRSKGLARKEALACICSLYACASEKEARNMLYNEQEAVVRRWQKGAPCLVETILSRWRGLLPES